MYEDRNQQTGTETTPLLKPRFVRKSAIQVEEDHDVPSGGNIQDEENDLTNDLPILQNRNRRSYRSALPNKCGNWGVVASFIAGYGGSLLTYTLPRIVITGINYGVNSNNPDYSFAHMFGPNDGTLPTVALKRCFDYVPNGIPGCENALSSFRGGVAGFAVAYAAYLWRKKFTTYNFIVGGVGFGILSLIVCCKCCGCRFFDPKTFWKNLRFAFCSDETAKAEFNDENIFTQNPDPRTWLGKIPFGVQRKVQFKQQNQATGSWESINNPEPEHIRYTIELRNVWRLVGRLVMVFGPFIAGYVMNMLLDKFVYSGYFQNEESVDFFVDNLVIGYVPPTRSIYNISFPYVYNWPMEQYQNYSEEHPAITLPDGTEVPPGMFSAVFDVLCFIMDSVVKKALPPVWLGFVALAAEAVGIPVIFIVFGCLCSYTLNCCGRNLTRKLIKNRSRYSTSKLEYQLDGDGDRDIENISTGNLEIVDSSPPPPSRTEDREDDTRETTANDGQNTETVGEEEILGGNNLEVDVNILTQSGRERERRLSNDSNRTDKSDNTFDPNVDLTGENEKRSEDEIDFKPKQRSSSFKGFNTFFANDPQGQMNEPLRTLNQAVNRMVRNVDPNRSISDFWISQNGLIDYFTKISQILNENVFSEYNTKFEEYVTKVKDLRALYAGFRTEYELTFDNDISAQHKNAYHASQIIVKLCNVLINHIMLYHLVATVDHVSSDHNKMNQLKELAIYNQEFSSGSDKLSTLKKAQSLDDIFSVNTSLDTSSLELQTPITPSSKQSHNRYKNIVDNFQSKETVISCSKWVAFPNKIGRAAISASRLHDCCAKLIPSDIVTTGLLEKKLSFEKGDKFFNGVCMAAEDLAKFVWNSLSLGKYFAEYGNMQDLDAVWENALIKSEEKKVEEIEVNEEEEEGEVTKLTF